MPYMELPDGVPLFYEDSGSDGPVVVLIHGWTMNGGFWHRNVAALAEAGNRVINVDLRGHGASGKTPEGHSLAQYARDIGSLVAHLELTRVTLVGWSMGVNVALCYVREFGTQDLNGLVFVDQSPRYLSADGWKFPLFGEHTNVDVAAFVQSFRHDRPTVIKPFLTQCFAEEPDQVKVNAAYAETTKTPTDAALGVWMDMVHGDFRTVVADIDVPVMLMYGEKSKIFPGDLAGWLAGQLADATVARFEHSGHVPFLEEPARFNRELNTFLATLN